MFRTWSPRRRRWVNSFAYTALVALVAGLGYLTFKAVAERRHAAQTPDVATEASAPLLELHRFSTNREATPERGRLQVSFRLRLAAAGTLEAFVFVLARNDHASPRTWAVWPPDAAETAVSAGGHFRSSSPTTGQPVALSTSWTRIVATLEHPTDRPPFETVLVYVVNAKGQILLARPFPI